ncbi:MAG TPA: dienelactone hydrolase family protein [Alphaproteobacteria bacterium]|nr:dienelactone hydrolase family protein [Alphaproteobacteria bacterium]
MAARYVTVAANDGGSFKAYLAMPNEGSGPGIVLLHEIYGVNRCIRDVADRYAEEGYIVLAPDLFWRLAPGIELGATEPDRQKALEYYSKFSLDRAVDDIDATVSALRALPECTGRVGALGFCLGGLLSYLAAARIGVDAAVAYYGVGIEKFLGDAAAIECPMVLHFGEKDSHNPPQAVDAIRRALEERPAVDIYVYADADHGFARPGGPYFHKPSAMMAHSRSIALLRRAMGPLYNLSQLWERHTYFEFGERDVDATMRTMVAEPYVNHVPTMTGGVGFKDLERFYRHHFVNSNPADTKLIPISRTVGADRVVDEMIFCFTHDREIDWMLPGIKPSGKYVEVPLVAIVNFRGDKLYHEHIYWDQASVLVQIGLLDPKLVPAAGGETARKVLDETLPSNELMRRWAESAVHDGAAAPAEANRT